MNKYINTANARHEDQKKVMEQIRKDGVCPFCKDNFLTYHKNPILHEGKYWYFTDNQWPYDHTKNHLIAVAKEHIEHLRDLPAEAGAELIEQFRTLAEKRGIEGGGITMRFGVPNEFGNFGSTVLHLHAHLIEPDLKNLPNDNPKFKFKIGEKTKNKKT